MDKNLLKIVCLFTAIIMCIDANAQGRIKRNYETLGDISTSKFQRNSAQTILPASIGGYYFEGFEAAFPPAGWQIVDVLDTTSGWNTSDAADFPASYEGLKSAYCQYSPAGPDGDDWFIAPKFTVAAGDSLWFQFKFQYLGYPPDSTFILISTTDSALSSFTDIVDFIADTVSTPATVLPLWTYKSYSLSAYVGQDIYIAFRNKNTLGDGVFIDNLEMGTRPAAEVATVSIDMDSYYPSGNSTPIASIKNYGGITQTFDVTMTITGGYSSTKSVTIAPQVTEQINFDPWNAAIGSHTINVQTLLSGDSNPANDTLSLSIKVLDSFVNYGWSTHDPLVAGTVGGAALSVCTNSNSRYFLIGGNINVFTSDSYEYDLSFATWAGINPAPSPFWCAATGVANGKLFVIGGENATNSIGVTRIYDYTTGIWTTGTPMPTPMSSAAFGTYKDSLVYVIGGNPGSASVSNPVQIYNMYTDSWTTGTSKPGDPVYGCRGGIVNNKIVVVGGFSFSGGSRVGTTYVGEIDASDPSQITWTQADDHPTGILSKAGSGVSLDSTSGFVVFTAGTNTNTTALTNRTFAFDVNSNSWKLGPNKPTAVELCYMTPVIQNDSIYLAALGGGDGSVTTDKNEWLNLGYFQLSTAVDEINGITDLGLFPNPTDEMTTLSLNLKSASQINISIVDVLGNTLEKVCDKYFSAGKNSVLINTKDLAIGVHFCIININGKIIAKKLLKVK